MSAAPRHAPAPAPAPAAPVRFALLGCGWVARDYVGPALAASPVAEAATLYDPDPAALDAVARRLPSASAHADLDDALRGVDAAYVAAPNHVHASLAEAAAAAGAHVLCEKPMADTLEAAERMVAACARAGVVYATAFDQRFHPAHVALRELIRDEVLGTVTAIRIAYTCWLAPDWSADNWRADPARAGGGALLDLAPHGVDLVQVLLGEPIIALHGLKQRRVHAYAVDDGAMLHGRTRDGVLASLHVAYNVPEHVPRRRLEVVGTRATAVATDTMGQDPGGRLEVDGAPVAFDTARSPFAAQLDAFATALRGGARLPWGPDHDLHTMRLLEPWR